MNESKPTHLDLFSGIGGFSLAAEMSGFRTVGFSEIDPYASAVLRKHWPDVPNFGDIRNIAAKSIGRVHLLTGGFPCQPFSVAGKQRGKNDDRDLWPQMFRVITEVRPAWILGENVAGFINMELDRTISDLEGAGYACRPIVIPACAVGAPHRRDRVWIIANSKSRQDQREGSGGLQPKPSQCDWDDSHANSLGLQEARPEQQPAGIARRAAQHAPDSSNPGLQGDELRGALIQGKGPPRSVTERFENEHWYEAATRFCGVDDGVPNRVDRIKALGNAIVPQVAYQILKEIRKLI